jgi:SsrA-binding protein
MKQQPPSIKNKKAFFEYTILDSWEAGVVLLGDEVKAIRRNRLDITGSYISPRGNNLYWVSANIAKYAHSSNPHYNPKRERKLLLRQQELERVLKALQSKGVTLIPLEGYFSHNMFKLKIGLGKGKRQFDKRETIKTRELEREIKRKIGRF